MRRRRRLTAALSLALGAAVLSLPASLAAEPPTPASEPPSLAAEPPSLVSEPPLLVSGDVVDRAGVLTAEEASELRQALAILPAEHDLRLTVVLVDSFDDMSGDEWAQQTFTLSYRRGGGGRALLAIAVDDHDYGYLERTILSTSRAEQLATQEVAPLVEQGRWADAAMAAAEGHTIARSIGGPPLGPRLWALALAGFLLGATVLVGLSLDRRRSAARLLQRERDETLERLTRATADLAGLRAQEAVVDPLLGDRERHTHLFALGSLDDDLTAAGEILAEVPEQVAWRGTRLPVIRGWVERVEHAGDRIGQADTQFEQVREELAEVQELAEGLARVDGAEEELDALCRTYAAVRDHARAGPQAQAGVEPVLRAAHLDLTTARVGLTEVRALTAEHRLRPAHALLEETLGHLSAAAGALGRAEEIRTWPDRLGASTDDVD